MCQMTAFSMNEVKITVRCTPEQRARIKAKAKAQHLSVSAYLLRQGLKDKRRRSTADASALSNLYDQLLTLNQTLKAYPATPPLQACQNLCQQVGREIVLYRLAQQAGDEN